MMSVSSSRSSASASKPSAALQSKSSPTAAAGEKPEPQSQTRQNYDKDSFEKGPSTSPSTSKASDPDAVAQKIAKDATGWKYDHTGGKTWEQTKANENRFDQSKSGVCTDMAMEAAQRFKKEGVDARVKFGDTDRGHHAWVEYQDSKGQWKEFDPTAAAGSKNADAAITPRDNGLYNYGKAFSTYEAPAES